MSLEAPRSRSFLVDRKQWSHKEAQAATLLHRARRLPSQHQGLVLTTDLVVFQKTLKPASHQAASYTRTIWGFLGTHNTPEPVWTVKRSRSRQSRSHLCLLLPAQAAKCRSMRSARCQLACNRAQLRQNPGCQRARPGQESAPSRSTVLSTTS